MYAASTVRVSRLSEAGRQRANCFYPGWAYAMPTTLLRIPYSFLMAFLLSCIIYWVVGYDSNPGRCMFFSLVCF